MTECNPSTIPADSNVRLRRNQCPSTQEYIEERQKIPCREAVGSLLFNAAVTRPDIMYAVSQASQFLTCWGREQRTAVKKIMCYLKQTQVLRLTFRKQNPEYDVVEYTDADYAGNVDTRKSTSDYFFLFNQSPMMWSSQQQ